MLIMRVKQKPQMQVLLLHNLELFPEKLSGGSKLLAAIKVWRCDHDDVTSSHCFVFGRRRALGFIDELISGWNHRGT